MTKNEKWDERNKGCDFTKHFAPMWYACVKNFFSSSLCGSQEVPETPKNFVMVSHSSRQANLSWGLPYDGQSPLLAFHLEFQRPVGKFLMRDHSSITSACFWLFKAHPPTYVRINSTVNQQKLYLSFSDPTHLSADVILDWSLSYAPSRGCTIFFLSHTNSI